MNLTATMNLETLNRADLYQLATHARINRRSTMNKAQLIAAIEALAEYNPDMYSAVELHYGVHIAADDTTPEPEAAPEAPADTATPERIALAVQVAAKRTGAYTKLCASFRTDGMNDRNAHAAAWHLRGRAVGGEFITVTLPGALRDILADTDALDGLHTAPGGARGSLRVTGTAAQLTDLTYDRLWVCAYNSSSEVHERAAYRRWLLALEDAGITL